VKPLLKITLALAVATPLGCGQGQEAKSDADRFEGTWKVVSIEESGKNAVEVPVWIIRNQPSPFGAPKGQKPPVQGMVFWGNAQFAGLGFHTLNPETSPKSLVASTAGGHGGIELPGIYKFEGDRLIICHASWGSNKRPTEFAAKPGCRLIVLSLVSREKDPQVEKFLANLSKPAEENPAPRAFKAKLVTRKPLTRISGPRGRVDGMAFSPDGKYLAASLSGGPSGEKRIPGDVRIWEVATGQEVRAFKGPTSDVTAVAFSPDGSRLAAACSVEMAVLVWDVKTGEQTLRLAGNRDWLAAMAYSANGERIASVGGDVRIWDVQSAKELRALSDVAPPGGRVTSVAFSPDGKAIAAAAAGKARVWDVETGKELHAFQGHSVAFSPDGKVLAVFDLKLTFNDVETGKERRALEIKGGTSFDFSANWQRLAAAEWSPVREIVVWDVLAGKPLYSFGSREFGRFVFSPDGRFIAIGAGEFNAPSELKIWETKALEE
jgi:WD40 repeat protein